MGNGTCVWVTVSARAPRAGRRGGDGKVRERGENEVVLVTAAFFYVVKKVVLTPKGLDIWRSWRCKIAGGKMC